MKAIMLMALLMATTQAEAGWKYQVSTLDGRSLYSISSSGINNNQSQALIFSCMNVGYSTQVRGLFMALKVKDGVLTGDTSVSYEGAVPALAHFGDIHRIDDKHLKPISLTPIGHVLRMQDDDVEYFTGLYRNAGNAKIAFDIFNELWPESNEIVKYSLMGFATAYDKMMRGCRDE